MTSAGANDVSPAVTVVWRRGDAFVAHAGHVVGVRWIGVPTVEQLVALSDAHRAASATGRDVLLVNDVVRLTGSTRVDPRIHERMRRLVEQARDRTAAVAHVIEVPGPAGAIVRAFLTALEQLAGNGRTRTASFESTDDAGRWLTRITPTAPQIDVAWAWREMARAAASSLAA